jgi:TolB protein
MMYTYRQLLLVCILVSAAYAQSAKLGAFTNSGDVGGPAIKGTAEFDAANGQYRITGAGANMWAKQDQFQYVWREMSGNFTVSATLRFLGQGNEHRKAGIMVRQSLDTDATYADVVIHGNGMPGLQWRSKQGEDTNTFDLPFDGPGAFQVKLVRTGVRVFMYIAKNGAESDTVMFSDVSVEGQATPAAKKAE